MTAAAALTPPQPVTTAHAVADAARRGLTSDRKSLPPWLFYDEAGSRLFEQITALPEYYLTRTERDLFAAHADDIFDQLGCPTSRRDVGNTDNAITIFSHRVTIAELGAGTASKTGILLRALSRRQSQVLYQPIDISPTALDEAHIQLEAAIPGVVIRPQIANYVTSRVFLERPPRTPGSPASAGNTRILALYIGSSIGNFLPAEARAILGRLRSDLQPGDALLLGTDLAPTPSANGHGKSVATLLAAYNDAQGVTAAFNRNILTRLNSELGADFRPDLFAHRALWNPMHSRIEIYLQSLAPQRVYIPANSAGPALALRFAAGEKIHTENSYKFTPAAISTLLAAARFTPTRTFIDPANLFAVTLATAV